MLYSVEYAYESCSSISLFIIVFVIFQRVAGGTDHST